jgi:hypothetical protein
MLASMSSSGDFIREVDVDHLLACMLCLANSLQAHLICTTQVGLLAHLLDANNMDRQYL